MSTSRRVVGLTGSGPYIGGSACVDYVGAHVARLSDCFDASNNPDGYICCAIAEDKLSFKFLEPLVRNAPAATLEDVGYDDPTGDKAFKIALANFWSKHMTADCRAVTESSICVAAGLCASLDVLLFALLDPGDAVLLPAPHFPGYTGVICGPRIGGVIVAVVPEPGSDDTDPDSGISIASLNAALSRCGSAKARVLLLTDPTNPGGGVFSEDALQAAVAWTQRHGLHLVIDTVCTGAKCCA